MALSVWYEDGSMRQVTADQRDMAALERAMKMGSQRIFEEMPIIGVRHLAYLALTRQAAGGLPFGLKHDEWEAQVVEVEQADDEVDPTPPGASDESLSESPTEPDGHPAKS